MILLIDGEHLHVPCTGVYGFCMDNRDGKFVEKLVFFYLSGYVAESWAMSEAEIEKYDEQAQNITSSLQTVDNQVRLKNQGLESSTAKVVTTFFGRSPGMDEFDFFADNIIL